MFLGKGTPTNREQGRQVSGMVIPPLTVAGCCPWLPLASTAQPLLVDFSCNSFRVRRMLSNTNEGVMTRLSHRARHLFGGCMPLIHGITGPIQDFLALG